MDDMHIQEVLELAPMGAFLSDLEGNCFFVNEEWERISGLGFDASLSKGWLDIIEPEDQPKILTFIKRYYRHPFRVPETGFSIRHPQRGIRHLSIKVRIPLDAKGRPLFVVGYVQDVTTQRLNMLRLQELAGNLERLNMLLDESQGLSKTGGWEYDLETHEVYWTNQTYLIMVNEVPHGFTPVYNDLLLFCDEAYAKGLEECAHKAITEGIPYDYEFRHIMGKWLRVIGVPVMNDSKVVKLRGAVMDITDRKEDELLLKKTKEALSFSNQLLDISQEVSKTGGWELNLATGEVFWTRQTYAIYGLPEDYAATLDTSLDFFDKNDSALIQSTLERATKEKNTFIIEMRTTTPANEKKWVRVIGVPFVKDGEVVRVRGAIMDITEKKEDELALIRAKDRAEDAARSKSEFLSVMSHEIRTPLNGIIGITSLLELDHTPEQQEYISNLSFSANHLLQLINDILDLHKIESWNMELKKTVTDLPELFRDIFKQFKPLAEAKNIRLHDNIHPEVPVRVLGDPVRLSQILNNLVSNAVKYTEEGEVNVSIHPVSITPQKAVLHFSIKDTGIGIPEELHDIVFESFRQAEQGTFRKHPGTGLGLTITKKLIELHGSSIFINSKAGEGTEFYFDLIFDLPVQQSAPARSGWSSVISGYEKKFAGLKLLFVEDNHVNVIVAKRQLEYFGIVPDCAQNAYEALELLKRNSYHMALLDLHMPEMDGYALADVVRKEYPDVHIVIFTADIMSDVRVRLAAMDIHDILTKPFMPQELLHVLLKVVEQKSLPFG